MSAQVAADLRAAAEVLRRDGWTQGGVAPSGVCAIEAIWRVTGYYGERPQGAVEGLRAVVPPSASIIRWNDAPGRTADEVIAALEAAADAAEQATEVGGRRSGLPGDVEPPADRDRHHGQD